MARAPGGQNALVMSAEPIGREGELASIEDFLERSGQTPSMLVLSGEPGIGKTVLWEMGVERARQRLARVLSYRAVEAETAISFAGLSELLSGVVDEILPSLAVPRRRALEVALLLQEPGERSPEPRAIGLALLDGVRALCATGPVIVAIDDLQWLDLPSVGVLQFALRRLRDDHVGFLATVRPAPGDEARVDLGRSLSERQVERLSVGPLSIGALFRVLRDRLGLELSRPQLVQLREMTGGNPFFALEVGRELATARPVPGRPFPVPGTLAQLLGKRLARLPADTREVLLSAAALARPTVAALQFAHGKGEWVTDALENAAQAGVVRLEDAQVRFAHPLLASV
jgi:predicted ATPase